MAFRNKRLEIAIEESLLESFDSAIVNKNILDIEKFNRGEIEVYQISSNNRSKVIRELIRNFVKENKE